MDPSQNPREPDPHRPAGEALVDPGGQTAPLRARGRHHRHLTHGRKNTRRQKETDTERRESIRESMREGLGGWVPVYHGGQGQARPRRGRRTVEYGRDQVRSKMKSTKCLLQHTGDSPTHAARNFFRPTRGREQMVDGCRRTRRERTLRAALVPPFGLSLYV